MKQNKGFTLIELLAVIVILAVIALIATPLVMSTINDAKKGAAISSGYGYIEALENSMGAAMIQNSTLNLAVGHYDGTNFSYSYSYNNGTTLTQSVSTHPLTVSYKGTNPTKVDLTITDGVVKSGTLVVNGFELVVTGNGSISAK